MRVSRKIIFLLDKRLLICDIDYMKSKKIDPRITALIKYRAVSGVSVRKLADAIGTTDATIYCWFKGRKVSIMASILLDRFLQTIGYGDKRRSKALATDNRTSPQGRG
jgi:AcrR family transcriptional regulator